MNLRKGEIVFLRSATKGNSLNPKATPLGTCAQTTPRKPRMGRRPWLSDEDMLIVFEKVDVREENPPSWGRCLSHLYFKLLLFVLCY